VGGANMVHNVGSMSCGERERERERCTKDELEVPH